MVRKRYVVRLHKLIRQEIDALARKEGHLSGTYTSDAIEEICRRVDVQNYEIHPDSETFHLKKGNSYKGETRANADKQMSIYLSDESYEKVAKITELLKEEVDKNIGVSFVIRDLLLHWLSQRK